MEKTTTKKTKKANKNLLIALGIACALLVIVVIGILMFFRSPERQVANGFSNLVNAKSIGVEGTVKSSGGGGRYEATINATTDKKVVDAQAAFKYQGEGTRSSIALSGKTHVLVADDGVLYTKVDQPKKLMASFADSFVAGMLKNTGFASLTQAQQDMALTPLRNSLADAGAKMDGKWLKISQSELRLLLGGGQETSSDCYVQFSHELENNKSARNELAQAYLKHQFVVIGEGLPSDGTSKGYRVSINQAKLKEFKDVVATNSAVKKLGSCGQDILTLGAGNDFNDQSVDLWIDQFSGNITRIKYDKITSDGDTAVDLRLSYGVAVNVTAPQNAIGLETVLPSITAAN